MKHMVPMIVSGGSTHGDDVVQLSYSTSRFARNSLLGAMVRVIDKKGETEY